MMQHPSTLKWINIVKYGIHDNHSIEYSNENMKSSVIGNKYGDTHKQC